MTRDGRYGVLLIAGAGRSGSTLLELMLDQVPGVVAVGELTDIWDAALSRNERCGCGRPFAECPFWAEVGERAFGGWDQIDAEAMLATHQSVARNRRLPLLLAGPLVPPFRAKVDEYASAISKIYDAVAATSGCRTIVDASKWPSHAMILRRIPGLDLRMVHLVRNPRGVAHSWAQTLERPHALGSRSRHDKHEMRRDHTIKSALHWTVLNLGIELIAATGVPQLFIRYEALVQAPEETLAAIFDYVAQPIPDEAFEFIRDGMVSLAPGHGIAGNPTRFRQGQVQLRAGDEWSTEMSRGARMVVGAITCPVELAYRGRASAGTTAIR